MIGGLSFVATLAFEIPFAKLEALLIGGILKQGIILISFSKLKYYEQWQCKNYYILNLFLSALMSKPSRKSRSKSNVKEEENILTKKYNPINGTENIIQPTLEKGNDADASFASSDAHGKTVIEVNQIKKIS